MPKWHFMFSDSLVCLGPWMQWCREWALFELSVPVWGVSEYIYTLLHLKYEFVSLSTGSQPRLCPGGFCALVFTSGLRRRGSGRWEGQHDGDGDTQSQDEDPRQHVGGGLGDCQGHTCTTPKKDFLMTPRRPRRSEAGRSFCRMRVFKPNVFTKWITKCFHECFCWFSGSASAMGPFWLMYVGEVSLTQICAHRHVEAFSHVDEKGSDAVTHDV